MERSRNVTQSQNRASMQQQQQPYDHRYHFHISERPLSSVKHMDKRSKSILCNSSGIIVAEMVYRCLVCKNIFETPLDCRTHFRCFHQTPAKSSIGCRPTIKYFH